MDISKYDVKGLLSRLGISDINPGATTGTSWLKTSGDVTESVSPVDGVAIAKVTNANAGEYEQVLQTAQSGFEQWRTWPAPLRGEVVRQIGLALRDAKDDLGFLVSLEMGKILQ